MVTFLAVGSMVLERVDWGSLFPPRDREEDLTAPLVDTDLFYTPNYDENIFNDAGYMDLNRLISFKESGMALMMTEEQCREYGKLAAFFADYIGAIIRGEADNYNALFSDDYFKSSKPKGRFTMQKLYDIEVEKLTEEVVGNYTRYRVSVKYKIRLNNGSFRNDVASDGARAQLLLLDDRSGRILINSVSHYVSYN